MSNYYSITIKDNLQYIYLTMFIMIYIVVILFYLKESNKNIINYLKNLAKQEKGQISIRDKMKIWKNLLYFIPMNKQK